MVAIIFPLVLSAIAAQPAAAFWRMPCANPLVIERADPIVNPGNFSGHLHTIMGGSSFSPSSTFGDLRKSKCTSCMVNQDLSNYWTPTLHFQWKNGSFSPVDEVGGHMIYYLPRNHPTDKTEVLAFPDGLKILTGSPFTRSYDASSLTAQAIGWNCLGGSKPTRKPGFPTENCPDGLRGEVRFPSCWDGKNTYKADGSHMAYSDGEAGPCPSTHQHRIVTLFYEALYSVDPWWRNHINEAKNPKQPLVLAMGDATGLGMHGDFLNGWDRDVLQTAIRTCTDSMGDITACKIFDLRVAATVGECHKTPDVNEIVSGTLKTLPGCNPVTATSAAAHAATCPGLKAPALIPNPVAYVGDIAPIGAPVLADAPRVITAPRVGGKKWRYIGCYSDSAPGVRALPTQLTIEKKRVGDCLTAAAKGGYKFAGIEYHGECWVANTLASSSKVIDYSKCSMTCTDSPLQICGGSSALTLYEVAR